MRKGSVDKSISCMSLATWYWFLEPTQGVRNNLLHKIVLWPLSMLHVMHTHKLPYFNLYNQPNNKPTTRGANSKIPWQDPFLRDCLRNGEWLMVLPWGSNSLYWTKSSFLHVNRLKQTFCNVKRHFLQKENQLSCTYRCISIIKMTETEEKDTKYCLLHIPASWK